MGTWVSSLRKRRGSSSNGKVIANGHDSGNEPPKMENRAALQQWKVDEPYLNLHCSLGEGPYYEKATNSLRFVDIIQRKLHTVSLDKGPESVTTLELDAPISVTSDVEGVDPRDRILVGLKYGLAMLDRKSGKYEYLTKFAAATEGASDDERLRSNDGAADALGRYWLGSMTDFQFGDPAPEGSLFCFASNKAPDTALTSLRIPNSVGWSPDGKTMYFTHTTASEMLAFDFSVDGHLSNQRVFYKHEGPGGPDGFRVDADGNIWHAIYGESRVIKISPQGKIIGQVSLPTKNITCVEFVGTEIFITTASDDEAKGGERSKETGGALFRCEVGVTGPPIYEFKLENAKA